MPKYLVVVEYDCRDTLCIEADDDGHAKRIAVEMAALEHRDSEPYVKRINFARDDAEIDNKPEPTP